jgi:glutamate transport system substrate-binding protein
MSEIASATPPWRSALTAVSVSLMLVLVGAAACAERAAPAETVESLRQKSPTLRDKARLRIAVRGSVPVLSHQDPVTGVRSGFEIEIAKALAEDLGYTEDRIEWVSVSSVPSRLQVLQGNQADMLVASLSITEEREKLVDFAGPYLLVPQAVLVRTDAKDLETISDLRRPGVHVCTGTGSTSEKALIAKGIQPDPVDTGDQCIAGLKSGKYQAYSTDLTVLASYIATNKDLFKILDLAIADTSERIGVAVPNGDEAMRDLVAYFLDRWLKEPASSPWLRAYDRTIGQYLDPKYRSQPRVADPPELADFDSKAPRPPR